MKSFCVGICKNWLPITLLVGLLVGGGFSIYHIENKQDRIIKQCEIHGGVWLPNEKVCLKGERIPVDE